MSNEKKLCYTGSLTNECSILFACALKLLFCGGAPDPSMDVGAFFGNLQVDGWMAVLQNIGQDEDINNVHEKLVKEANEIEAKHGCASDEYQLFCHRGSTELAGVILQRYGGLYNLNLARGKTMKRAREELLNAFNGQLDTGNSFADALANALGAKVVKMGEGNPFKELLDAFSGAAKASAN